MQTAAISYRVAEFLQRFAPFQAIDECDLVQWAGRGRVKFHESGEFIYWQGNPAGAHLFVVQQGTVRIVEDDGGTERLRDIRGAGDMIGAEAFLGNAGEADSRYRHSAQTASDVILYALPGAGLAELAEKYPAVARYLRAHGTVTAGYAPAEDTKPLTERPLFDLLAGDTCVSCAVSDPVSTVAAALRDHAAEAAAIVDEHGRLAGAISRDQILEWVASGGKADSRAADIVAPVRIVPPATTVSEGVLAMNDSGIVALTADGTPSGSLAGLITTADLYSCFGDRPGDILSVARHARNTNGLREANRRARAFLQSQLRDAQTAGWLAEWACAIDTQIAARLIALEGAAAAGCWFFYGAAARGEQLTAVLPSLGLIGCAESDIAAFHRVRQALGDCGYLANAAGGESAATLEEWTARFRQWIAEPIQCEIAARRQFFDQLVIAGGGTLSRQLWETIESAISLEPAFVRLLAHDSLSSLPPLTFFRGLVIDTAGREHQHFELDKHMLTPVADCARVFGLASGRGAEASTRERLRLARNRHPEQDSIFRAAGWASDLALQVRARQGIRRGNSGAEVMAATLSRHEQQLLKTAFAHIGRLLEFTSTTHGLGVR
jgi:CBS domain-containing protein